MGWQLGQQEAQCQALGVGMVSQLSCSIAQLHINAVDAVVLPGIDQCSWQSSRKPLTWPDAPGSVCSLPLEAALMKGAWIAACF